MERKLEKWQAATIQSLVGERERTVEEAQKTISGINAAIEHYAKEWADGQEGPFGFESRPDGDLYLVQAKTQDDTADVAPAD